MKSNATGNLFKTTMTLSLIMLLAVGCTKRYVITDELTVALPNDAILSIGAILDDLPIDTPEDEKPTSEHIDLFKAKLFERISKKDLFESLSIGNDSATYELSGSIVDYKEGSGLMRFLVGFGAGSSKINITLELREKRSRMLIFGGTFTGTVSSWGEKGEKMFDTIAKDFAKSLDKALKKYAKGAY